MIVSPICLRFVSLIGCWGSDLLIPVTGRRKAASCAHPIGTWPDRRADVLSPPDYYNVKKSESTTHKINKSYFCLSLADIQADANGIPNIVHVGFGYSLAPKGLGTLQNLQFFDRELAPDDVVGNLLGLRAFPTTRLEVLRFQFEVEAKDTAYFPRSNRERDDVFLRRMELGRVRALDNQPANLPQRGRRERPEPALDELPVAKERPPTICTWVDGENAFIQLTDSGHEFLTYLANDGVFGGELPDFSRHGNAHTYSPLFRLPFPP